MKNIYTYTVGGITWLIAFKKDSHFKACRETWINRDYWRAVVQSFGKDGHIFDQVLILPGDEEAIAWLLE